MKDQPYFFPHDTTASNDPKMMALWSECGLAGMAAFWIIVEILHQQEDGQMPIESLRSYLKLWCSREANAEQLPSKIEQMLIKTKLLLSVAGFATSQRVQRNMEKRVSLSKKRSESGKKGAMVRLSIIGEKIKRQAIAEQDSSNCQATSSNCLARKEVKDTTETKIKSKSKSLLVPTADAVGLVELLKSKILTNNPNAKIPDKPDKWLRVVDLMLSVDKRPPGDVRRVIEWCQADDFWKCNILSMGKLRTKYDSLWMRMKFDGTGSNGVNKSQFGAAVAKPGKYDNVSISVDDISGN